MNRRDLLAAAALTGVAAGASAATADPADEAFADAALRRYAGFGVKHSGGPGDQATGAWMEGRIHALGFRTERQAFEVPFFETERAVLEVGDARLDVLPQAPWSSATAGTVSGPLMRWPGAGSVRGAIAVVALPFRRWSSSKAPEVQQPVRSALAAGAAAVVIVTTGPTGEIIALNAPVDAMPFSAPVVLLGSKAAAPMLAALDTNPQARLTIAGRFGRRQAYNVTGRLDRGARRWLMISTPRSGWTGCAGERGPGVAVWLALAAWAKTALPDFNVAMLATSGHEFENAGGRLFIEHLAPKPDETAAWVHLGANIAARDWLEFGPSLLPLPSADPQRVLVVPDALLPTARAAFAGQPGLEAPFGIKMGTEGEVKEILAAGYTNVAAVFGAHRFHHVATDDLRCVEPRHVAEAIAAFKVLTRRMVA